MNNRRKLMAVLGAGTFAVTALIAYLAWFGYQEALRSAETTSRNYAAIIEARFEATLRRAEAHLQELAGNLPAAALSKQAVPRFAAAIDSGLDLRRLNFPELVGLRVFDRNGDLIYTSESKTTLRANAADRDYFRLSRDNTTNSLTFSEVAISRITGRSAMFIARAIRGRSGEFLGVVSASVEINYFQDLFESLNIGTDGIISIYRSDTFTAVVRRPALAQLNAPLPPNSIMSSLMASGKKIATLESRSNIDGHMRIYSFHLMQRYPFYVTVAISRDDALAGWRLRTWAAGLSALLGVLILAGMLYRLWRAEIDLRQRDMWFSAAFDQAAVGMGIRKIDSTSSHWMRVNQKLCDILGYSRAELLNLSYLDVTLPSERNIARAYNDSLLSRSISQVSREKRLVHKNGGWVWVEATISLISDAGHATHVLSVVQDISERKRIEQSMQLTQFSIDKAADAVTWIRSNAVIVYANDAACRLLGRERREIVGKSVIAFDPHFTAENWPEHWATMKRLGAISYETHLNTRTANDVHAEVTANFIAFQGQEYCCAFKRDISARKIAEETRARLATIVQTSNDAIMSRDLDNKILTWNASAERLFGYTAEEAIGKISLILVPPEFSDEVNQARDRIMHGEAIFEYETVRLTRDGRRIDVSLSRSPITDAQGNITGVSLIFRDISERKQAEAAVRESRTLLSTIIGSAMDAIITVDASYHVLVFNRAAEAMFGCAADDAIGSPLKRFIADKHHAWFIAHMQAFVEDGRVLQLPGLPERIDAVRGDSDAFPVEATIACAETGGKLLLTIMLRDIIGRIAAAEAQRDALVREVHHRIKNNLQGVIGLTRRHLAAHPALTELAQKMIGEVGVISVIHGLHGKHSQYSITLHELAVEISRAVMALTHATVAIDAPKESLTATIAVAAEEAVPLALVINELLYNASKHARQDGEKIALRIRVRGNAQCAQVTVSNHGDLPAGFDLENNIGLGTGLELVKSLLPRRGAELQLASADGDVVATLTLRPPVLISEIIRHGVEAQRRAITAATHATSGGTTAA